MFMQSSIRILVLACSLAPVLFTPLKAEVEPAPPRYSLEEINIPARASDNGVKAINNAGDVVGTLDTAEHHHAAFLYHKGQVRLLGTLGGKESWASAINDTGQIVGVSESVAGRMVPFLWEQGRMREIRRSVPTPLGIPAEVGPDTLTGLNNKGQVIGCTFGLDGFFAPILWQLEQGVRVQDPEVSRLGFVPTGLNDAGKIVGYIPGRRPFGVMTAVLWDGHKQQNLGTLILHGTCRPLSVNNRGQVVGVASTEGIYKDHAFLWDGNTLHDLGTAGGRTSAANAINNKGQIVGEVDIQYEEHNGNNSVGWGGNRAILWQDGKAYNINDLIPKEAGWVLERAVSINDRGQIVGTGYHSNDLGKSRSGGIRAFLLTPH